MSRERQVVVAVDYGQHAAEAVTEAFRYAEPGPARVHAVLVVEGQPPALPDDLVSPTLDDFVRQSRDTLDEYVRERATPGVAVEAHVRFGEAAEEVVALAVEVGADLVVVGTHGRSGLARLVLGSVAEHVVREAPCPVLVARAKR